MIARMDTILGDLVAHGSSSRVLRVYASPGRNG